jgi:hypothetical protein
LNFRFDAQLICHLYLTLHFFGGVAIMYSSTFADSAQNGASLKGKGKKAKDEEEDDDEEDGSEDDGSFNGSDDDEDEDLVCGS